MGVPAVSFTKKFLAAFLAVLLTVTLVPASALAEGENDTTDALAEEPQEVSAEQVDEGSGVAPMLASGLVGNPSSFVSADVALDSEPVIGSFTVDGLTFAVAEGSDVELVGVSSDRQQVTSSQEGDGSPVAPMLASGPDGLDADSSALAVPESVTCEGVDYAVTSIGAYAFYLSGVTSVELSASITQVDDRAFRSSDVAAVEVADGNPSYSSFDGALYDADRLSLLLIPEGKQGTVLLPKTAEVAPPSVFSHCSLVQAIAVEEGSAAFASENGLLYTSDLTTLLRVPAGATDITIRDGCTTIAAGAMEACASLATITAPASVISISPYLFEQEPETVMAPVAVAAVEDEAEGGSAEEGKTSDATSQLTAMVALSATDDDLPAVDPAVIAVSLPADTNAAFWHAVGFDVNSVQIESEAVVELENGEIDGGEADLPIASPESASSYAAGYITYRKFNLPTVYYRRTLNGTQEAWKTSDAELNTWLETTTKYSSYRFYNGNLYLKNSSVTIRYATSTSGGAFDGCRVGTSPNNLTEAAASSSYTTIPSNFYIQMYKKTTVSLLPNGGTAGSQSKVDLYYADTAALPAGCKPTRAGYTFTGFRWTVEATSTKYFNADLTAARAWDVSTDTDTLYAHWSINTYTITWNANGGSVSPASSSKTYGTALGTLPTPTRTGYTFAGWFTAATGGSQISTTTTVPAANTTYYAHWTANSYTVEYWNKAGTTKLSSDTGFKYDTARNLAAKPTSGVNAGYTAVGWSSSANQSTATYGFSSSQKNLATSGTKKLYLAETANTITLTWNSQGGSAVANTTQAYSASTKVKLPANPTKTGYTFKGWFTAASGGTQVTANTALPSSNTTYHAQWTANSYTVEYWNKAGTTKLSSDTGFKYDTARNLAAKPTSGVNAGYTAVGWATSANQSSKSYDFGSSQKNLVTSGTKKLYLAETANTIRTTWNYNGGAIDGNAGSTYRDTVYASGKKLGDALEADFWAEGRLARAGYRFAGWFTAASGGTQVSASTALPTANATYYAHWVPAGPQVRFLADADVIWRTIDRSWGSSNGAESWPVPYSGVTYTASLALASGHVDAPGVPSAGDPQEVTYHVGLTQSIGGVTSAWLVTGDAEGRKTGSWLSSSATSIAGAASADVYLNGYGASTITWDAGEGECATERTEDVMPYATATAPAASRKGYIMAGWYDGTGEEAKLACKPGGQTPQVTEDVTYHAKWVPSISAVAPIEATVRLDILGTEEQAMDEEAPGYIESRCGEPLDVAEVAFEAKAGAAELFGAHVPDIELQALPGEGASWATGSPAFSFALDAAGDAAIESDAARLAPFAMAGYEVRIPISYRFRIPDELLEEVLAAIDPARFEQVTTPVCSVVYTVALASQEGGEEGA